MPVYRHELRSSVEGGLSAEGHTEERAKTGKSEYTQHRERNEIYKRECGREREKGYIIGDRAEKNFFGLF